MTIPSWHRFALATGQGVSALLPIAQLLIVLAAIASLPIADGVAFLPVRDGDARTITESRSIVEVVVQPGLHRLHQGYSEIDRCEQCPSAGSDINPEPRFSMQDVAPRVAALPEGEDIRTNPPPVPHPVLTQRLSETSPLPAFPPPRLN